jgi:hypothetical protein
MRAFPGLSRKTGHRIGRMVIPVEQKPRAGRVQQSHVLQLVASVCS